MQQSQFVIQNKFFLRKIAKETRKVLFDKGSLNDISSDIVLNIKNYQNFQKSKNVMLFHPTKFEINLLDLLSEDKTFYLPRCNGELLDVCQYETNDTLKSNKYNIKEPITPGLSDLSTIDIIFIPALSADKNFNRLGYGGGFYDRFLSNENIKAEKIVVIPNELLYDSIPEDTLDVKADCIITQTNILSRNIS